jgi:hypothetical protein
MKATKEMEFNDNPPLSVSDKRYMILRNKEEANLFWTSGGEYRSDWYEVIYQSDDVEEVKDMYMKIVYSPNKPF